MRITYFKDDDSLLGSEQSTGITEVVIPGGEHFDHPITITKMFEGEKEHRWKVVRIEHPSPIEAKVYLESRSGDGAEYLSKTHHRSNRKIMSNLQMGTLVEVEYGYQSSVKKNNGDVRSCKRYPSLKQHGEMHKRRLAIVVSTSPSGVQVVPVTSRSPSSVGDLSIFEIEPHELSNLIHYSQLEKRSFGLAKMIETVSLTRILPPLTRLDRNSRRRGSERSTSYKAKLSKGTIRKLKSALTAAVGVGDYFDIKKERSELFEKNKAITIENDKLQSEIQRLQRRLMAAKDVANDYGIGESWDVDVEQYIKEMAEA